MKVEHKISEILDKFLPSKGVGTKREKLRMNLHNEISLLFNKPKEKPLDILTTCDHIWKHGYTLEPVVFCMKCNKDADDVYIGMPYSEQVRLVVD